MAAKFNVQQSPLFVPAFVGADVQEEWHDIGGIDNASFPFVLVAFFMIVHVVQGVASYVSNTRSIKAPAAPKRTRPDSIVTTLGGGHIYAFMVARLVGSSTLLGLAIGTLVKQQDEAHSLHFWRNTQLHITLTFVYTSVLALVAITIPKWSQLATRYNIVVLLVMLTVYTYRDVWPLATYAQTPVDISEGRTLWTKVVILFFTAVVIPLFVPRRYVPVDPKNPMPQPNDEQTGSWFSLLLYTFLDPVIQKGYRVPHLPHDQLPPQADYDRAKYMTGSAFPHLDPFRGAKRRHLFFGLMRVFRLEYVILASMLVIQVIVEFFAPIGINRLLNYVETDGQGATVRPWVWVLCIFFGPFIRILVYQWYIFIANRTLVRTEALLTQLVFEHSLRIRLKAEVPDDNPGGADDADDANQGPKEAPGKEDHGANLIGKINNLVTSDLNNITEGRDFLVVALFVPLEITAAMFYLYHILGWSSVMGLMTMVVLFPIPGYVSKLVQDVQQTRMKQTDARVQDVTEAVNVLRMIKLFGWEEKMSKRIAEKRETELSSLWKMKVLGFVTGTIAYLIPMISMVVTYAVYAAVMKGELTSSKIFSSMPIFSMIRMQLNTISSQITIIIQGKVSLDRVDNFLKETELLDSFHDDPKGKVAPGTLQNSDAIGFKNAAFSWSEEPRIVDGTVTPSRRTFRLKVDGELLFKEGCINLIVGPTGSGKTSMLMALLGEMHYNPTGVDSWFNLPRAGGVAYAAQESWVQNDTIRENILFGSPYDEARYRKVIKQCALERDLELFEAGDATEVGEKGLTLSGGQKARVTLARAIYSPAKILLLDDILAALDVHTSAWIVNHCFKGDLVEGRTVLLVTHNVALASPIARFVVTLAIDGTVSAHEQDIKALANGPDLAEEIEAAHVEGQDGKNQEVVQATSGPTIDGKLIAKEEIEQGHVTWKSIKLFVSALGGNHPFAFFAFWMVSILITDWTATFQIWFLGYWGSQYETHDPSEVNVAFYLGIYSLLMCTVFAHFLGHLLYLNGAMRASRVINKSLVESVLHSTWLDETPTGRIISRCTQDIRAVDGPIPQHYSDITTFGLAMTSTMTVIIIFTPFFLFPSLAVAALAVYLGNMYMKAQMSVKREMSNARSPLLSHFSAAIAGTVSVRAYGAQEAFKSESLKRVDHYVHIARVSFNLNRWIAMRIDLIGATFTASLAAYSLYAHSLSASNTGFSLNLAVDFCTMVLMVVRFVNDFEVQANSLERIQGFIDIEHEPSPIEGGKPPAAWPTSGDLRVEGLSARYSQTGPKVLHDLSFHIKSGQRIGIVGRTGSGKSSLTLALLRCILTEGNVYYDGVLTSKINLDALRSSITIIPQTPELLSGTLRRNLDPFDQHDDATLNDALRAAGLFSLQEKLGEARLTLDSNIASSGSNLSVGQKQILALARAMVRGSKVLILDEATSAIDYTTDSVIQATLRHKLPADVTVITVAHRLQTIMDADRIMVLDSGKIIEFDSPAALLEKDAGLFKALVDGSGDRDALYEVATGGKSSRTTA
ncbi:hypothetical protein D9613_006261 [Agrocybe pediades]|uniref:P-loop containing nucleoside triphosphate hydrolase protein n=1 Tax=Agrocybe pediades TaxID=84607 RepID=A0A8H4QUH9_9AGAR|nr:hypothetical protein D9613_006261 [Agrocybe pediades]